MKITSAQPFQVIVANDQDDVPEVPDDISPLVPIPGIEVVTIGEKVTARDAGAAAGDILAATPAPKEFKYSDVLFMLFSTDSPKFINYTYTFTIRLFARHNGVPPQLYEKIETYNHILLLSLTHALASTKCVLTHHSQIQPPNHLWNTSILQKK
jgi:hypothetical protein